jgi:hypothetical protein
MECPENPIPLAPPPAEAGCFTWKGFLLAMLAAPVLGLVVARVSERGVWDFEPLILFPVLLGVFAGIAVVWLVRLAQIGNRPTIVVAAMLAAAVTATGEHYFTYLTYRSEYYRPRVLIGTSSATGQDLSALGRAMAPSFGEYMQAQARHGRPLLFGYMAHGWAAWLSWAIDALLIVAAAVVVTIPALRVPYCNRCGSWFRTIRSGRIDVLTAGRLAALVGVDAINHPRSHRYRLSTCQGGCGPTRLELSWEEADGAVDLVRLWLDPAARNQVAAILDIQTNDQFPMTNDQ